MARDIFGKALLDFHHGNYEEGITTFSSLGEQDILPLPYLFRTYKDMPPLEKKALKLCTGTVLDIGCGAGSHSLYLQQNGFLVTALDISEGAIACCSARGLKKTVHSDIYAFNGTKFDTLLVLMNGIGIVGQLVHLDRFLLHLKSLLNAHGQILLDSSDIIYMFDKDEDGGYWVPGTSAYYGEVEFTMEYKGETSTPFNWLYLDFNRLKNVANACNFSCELVSEGEHYDYLARLRLKQ